MKQPILTEDNLTEDLKTALSKGDSLWAEKLDSGEFDYNNSTAVLEQLTIFIVNRDHKVLQHGINLGKEQANGNRKS